MILRYGRFVKIGGLDVNVDAVFDTPVEVVCPVLAGEELEFNVGIVFADVFETWFHRGQDDTFVTETVVFDEFDEHRDVRAVVAVDAGCPFQFDEGADAIFLTDVEIFLSRTETAGILDAVAGLSQRLSLEFFESRTGDGQGAPVSRQTRDVVIVGTDELFVFGDLEVGFEILITEFRTVGKRFNRVFQPVHTAAVTDENRPPRKSHSGRDEGEC